MVYSLITIAAAMRILSPLAGYQIGPGGIG
jgi:hypothetical protein